VTTVAYATPADLDQWLPVDAAIDDVDRLLARATELVDSHVRAPFAVNRLTQLPSDATVAAAMRDSVCAQVEFWLEVGEDHDVDGQAGKQVGIGQLSITSAPELSPRARRLLANAGLLTINETVPSHLDAPWRFE
jgi:hypothetical protein